MGLKIFLKAGHTLARNSIGKRIPAIHKTNQMRDRISP
jgi:hypothetical protein